MRHDMIRSMSAEEKERLHSIACWWCSGKNDSYHLNVGPGIFRDFDSDLSYGIPICGGCGGLGFQYETEDFKERTQKIMDLRFKYRPSDPKERKGLSVSEMLQTLVYLENEVKDLVEKYGSGVENSFAKNIIDGGLSETKNLLKEAAKAEKAKYN